MSDSPKEGEVMVDSWEELLDTDTDNAFERLNEALEKVQISGKQKKTADPFAIPSSGGHKEDSRLEGLRHLAILHGSPLDVQDAIQRLKRDLGVNVRGKQINDSNLILIFSNSIDARHAIRSSQKFSPLRICAIDDAEFQHLDYVFEHSDQLKPAKSDIRPSTNMSVIRNTVTRHLNVNLPSSAQHQEEKEQLRRARESKKAQADLWK